MPEGAPFEVRHLGPRDVDVFRAQLDMFGEAFNETTTYGNAQPGAAYLIERLSDPNFTALVALRGGDVIGGLAAYVLRKFEQDRSEVYIYDLAVREAERRQGVATALIQALKPIARARGAYVIFVQADPVDAPAVALYGKLGIREDVYHFDIET